jgi:hypothetical protein
MNVLKLLAALLTLAALPSWADDNAFMDGVRLHSMLEAQQRAITNRGSPGDDLDSMEVAGYISGVADALGGSTFCIPGHTTYRQLGAIVKKYLDDHPARWQHRGDSEITLALNEAFPCQKQK